MNNRGRRLARTRCPELRAKTHLHRSSKVKSVSLCTQNEFQDPRSGCARGSQDLIRLSSSVFQTLLPFPNNLAGSGNRRSEAAGLQGRGGSSRVPGPPAASKLGPRARRPLLHVFAARAAGACSLEGGCLLCASEPGRPTSLSARPTPAGPWPPACSPWLCFCFFALPLRFSAPVLL